MINSIQIANILAVVVDGKWEPGIGDPTFLGWLIVAVYLITAVICILCAQKAAIVPKKSNLDDEYTDGRFIRRQRTSKLPWFWWLLTALMLILAINKQLDLQTWFTFTAKDLAKADGWYAQRRTYQVAFIIAIAAIISVIVALIGIAVRYDWHRVWLSVVGLGLLGSFIVIRAVSFHHIDVLLGLSVGGVKLNAFLELGGISCITLCALKYLRWI